jgi:hypothetical protein
MADELLATIRSMDELQQALRARALGLRLVFDGRCRVGVNRNGESSSLDSVAGLPDGYSCKLLAPVPIKGLGRTSLALQL